MLFLRSLYLFLSVLERSTHPTQLRPTPFRIYPASCGQHQRSLSCTFTTNSNLHLNIQVVVCGHFILLLPPAFRPCFLFFVCQHGKPSPDLHTPPKSSRLANIRVAFGPALSRELVELECSEAEELLDEAAAGEGGGGEEDSGKEQAGSHLRLSILASKTDALAKQTVRACFSKRPILVRVEAAETIIFDCHVVHAKSEIDLNCHARSKTSEFVKLDMYGMLSCF